MSFSSLPGSLGAAVKLVYAVDAVFPPLTGIGRYAWELARGLAQWPAQDVQFFLHGRFVPNPALKPIANEPPPRPGRPAPLPLKARLRARLARSEPVVKLYAALMPQLQRWRLRHLDDHVFHSPNYFLPPFGGPALATVHDLSTLLYPQFHPAARVAYMNAELPKTLRRASHLITVSEFVRAEMVAHLGWPAERITAIALGVDARFAPRDAADTQALLAGYGLRHGGYVLCVATIEPRKNIERLVAAHQALPQSLRERWPLVLAGAPGWNSEALHGRIKQLQGAGLHYLDFVPQADLYALYAGARVFAFVSLYEGFGLPVLEAMASGVPVLMSDRASLPEVAAGAALQVDALDVPAIRDGLARALQDDTWRAQAVAAGLQRASAFSWQRCFAQTCALYARFAPGGTGAGA